MSDNSKKYFFIITPWLVLALIFWLQNQAFISWLDLDNSQYILRRSLVCFSLGLFIYLPGIWLRKNWQRYGYWLASSIFVSIIFLAEYLYFSYAHGFLQFSSLLYAGEAGEILGTVKILLQPKMVLFLANIFLVLTLIIWGRQTRQENVSLKLKFKLPLAILSLLLVIFSYGYLVRQEQKEWGNADQLYQYSKIYDFKKLVGEIGIVNFYLEDMANFLTQTKSISPADQQLVSAWSLRNSAAISGSKYFGIAKGRNLIFIQVESLENAVIWQKIGGQEITPNLNKLAKQGLYFSNYYSPVGPGNTADAEFITLNSLYPLANEVAFINYAQNKYDALPGFLRQNGYHSFVLHGDVPSFWNRANMYPALGYDQWFSQADFSPSKEPGYFDNLGDDDFFQQAQSKLQNLPQPFFASLITLSSHTPFSLPADQDTLPIPANSGLNDYQTDYLKALHYTDAALGKFLSGLQQTNLYNNSVIVIYGDHGSFTGISKVLNGDENSLAELRDSQVPLIILAPKLKLAGEIRTPASHIDLYPTVVNLLGIKTPATVLGHDVLNASPVVTDRNLISGTIRVILSQNLAYESAADGQFGHGDCLSWPAQKVLDVSQCADLFNQQNDLIKVSDLVIRGNALNLLAGKSLANISRQPRFHNFKLFIFNFKFLVYAFYRAKPAFAGQVNYF